MCVPPFARGRRTGQISLPCHDHSPAPAPAPCSSSHRHHQLSLLALPLLALAAAAARAWTGPLISLARGRRWRWWQRWLVVRGGRKKGEKKSRGTLRCSAPVGVTRFGLSLSLSFFLSRTREALWRPGGERAVTSELFQWRPLLPLLSSPARRWGGGSAGGRLVLQRGGVLGW
ncbi:hypothetical protein PVAP13_5KG426107 [Panicum virgatum]|uniref:Uncharacterized protein n=1 Tax=Panicum virgatum TaxID=38727 RepID=A0A8T0SJD2_PANVG|nr:hypothetical protein PVAP13_5KG426107 [Panicum virgatum]